MLFLRGVRCNHVAGLRNCHIAVARKQYVVTALSYGVCNNKKHANAEAMNYRMTISVCPT